MSVYKIRPISDLKPTSYQYIVRNNIGVGVLNYKKQLKYTLETTYWGERYLDSPYGMGRNYYSPICKMGNLLSNKYPHGYILYSKDEKFESRRYI